MTILPLILMLVVFYAVVLVPQRRRQQRQRELLQSVSQGDEILTTGGIYGGVTEVDGEDLYLEIAKGVEIKITRRAIAERIYSPNAPDPASATAPPASAVESLLTRVGLRKKS